MPALMIALIALSSHAVAAPIYKWVDSDNRVHYEDTRPPAGEVDVIKPPEIYRGETSGDATPSVTQTAGDDATARTEERQRMCAQSKERLAEGQGADRMYTLDDKGNRTYMTAEQVAAHVAKLQEAVDSWCKEE